jgi:hypothetical protein
MVAAAGTGYAQDLADEQTPAQQTPAQQTTPPQQTTPTQQQPQNPPATPDQIGKPNLKLPPPPPKIVDVRMPGEAGFSIGVFGWRPFGNQYLDKGHGSTFSGSSFLPLATDSHGAFGVDIGVAAGQHNTIKASYFYSKTIGSVTAPTDIVVFGQTFTAGERMTTNAKLSDVKISYEYLTWPYPVERRHFRLKTLWQMQYVTLRGIFDDPVKSATPDVNGNITSIAVLGSKSFFTPAFGLGFHEYATRNFHFEADVSGFALPHRFQLVDSEVTIGYRVGKIDVRGGLKYFHFRTSPKQDYFYRGNLTGAFVGIRWHSD